MKLAIQPTQSLPLARASYKTLRELVLEQLLEGITQGRLKPGQKLVEGELALLYGVSRGPIREAIRTLESQGLVTSISSKGAVVARLSAEEIDEVFEIRIALEGLAARYGTQNISKKQLEEMKKLLDKMAGSLDDAARWQKHTHEFHLSLYRASGRRRLYELVKGLTNLTAAYGFMFLELPGHVKESHPDHVKLFDAVAQGDAEQAEQITADHYRKSAASIARLLAQQTGVA